MKVLLKLDQKGVSVVSVKGEALFDIHNLIPDVTTCITGYSDFLAQLDKYPKEECRGLCVKSFVLDGVKKQFFIQVTYDSTDELEQYEVYFQDYTFLKLEDSPFKVIHHPTNQLIKVADQEIEVKSVLKEQEFQILYKIMDGLESAEIADSLGLSVETVKRYRKDILKKTGCKSFYEVISKYFKNSSL